MIYRKQRSPIIEFSNDKQIGGIILLKTEQNKRGWKIQDCVFMRTHKRKIVERRVESQDIKRRRKWQFLGILVSKFANKESNQRETPVRFVFCSSIVCFRWWNSSQRRIKPTILNVCLFSFHEKTQGGGTIVNTLNIVSS